MISLLIAVHLLFFADLFGRFEKYLYLCHCKQREGELHQ